MMSQGWSVSLFHASQQWSRWSRRLASYSMSTFPSAPPRTGRAPFGAPSSPVSLRERMIPGRFRCFASRVPPRPGLRTPTALPHVDGFPALGVLRRLRRPAPRGASGDPTFPWCWTCRARRRCLVRLLEWDEVPSPTAWKVRATTTLSPYRGGPAVRRCVGGCTLASLETEVRTIRSSPYRAGLAGRDRQRLRTAPASTACYGPLWLSPPGKPLAQGSCLPNPSFLRKGSSAW